MFFRGAHSEPPFLTVGPHRLTGRVFLAPMAGVTDAVFRGLCARFGAALTFSEMITSDVRLWKTEKTRTRLVWSENEPIQALQLAGAEPEALVAAALAAVEAGATWVDVNMGCPMKKVCRQWAGSALMSQPKKVAAILKALVSQVPVPITLKTRTGAQDSERNVVHIAQIAEEAGVQMMTVHGRTRAQRFTGAAEYDSIAAVKARVSIPVIANGDIQSAEHARAVLAYTKADGIMIGRGALGQPWLFERINRALNSVERSPAAVVPLDYTQLIVQHVMQIHHLYGEHRGVRVARKHLNWYALALGIEKTCVKPLLQLESASAQLAGVAQVF